MIFFLYSIIGEATTDEIICPEITTDQNIFLKNFAYWIEGVILLSIGCPGILGMYILTITEGQDHPQDCP